MSSISGIGSARAMQSYMPVQASRPAPAVSTKADSDGDFDGSRAGEVESSGKGGEIDRYA